MGRILDRNDSLVHGNYPGCMAGLLHILDYHHWHNVRKLLPHKRRSERRRRKLDRSPKINARNFGEEYISNDVEPLLVKQNSTEQTVKTGSKVPSEEPHRSWILSFHLNSWLHRTNHVHHLEPLESGWDRIDSNAKVPARASRKRSVIEATEESNHVEIATSKDGSDHQLGEHVDILEMFKVNKEIFLKILQDTEACRSHTHGLKNSNIKVRLAKSRSFPVASSSQARYVKPSTLKHKQNEVWFFVNGEKSVPEEPDKESVRAGDGKEDTRDETSLSSLGSSKGVNGQGWNQVVISRFRDIKQKIKQVLKESKKEKTGHRSIQEASKRDAFGTYMSERLEITVGQESNEIDGLNHDLQRVRRTSSLSDSLSRYTQLFDNTFGSETRKFSHSKSLRLMTSEEKLSNDAQKSYQRNLSLPELDSLTSFLNVVAPRDALRLGMTFKILSEHGTFKNRDKKNIEPGTCRLSMDSNNCEPLEISENRADIDYSAEFLAAENENGMTEMAEDSSKPARERSDFIEDHIGRNELPQENKKTDFDSCFSEGLFSPAVFPLTEGLDLNTKYINTLQQDTENEDFNYVRHVLELSGYTGDEEAPTWHSIDQPLSPSLFKQLEECFDCYEDEITGSFNDSHHQLLFDLVSEKLVDMNEYTYFPRPFSRPMPKGNSVLQNVWTTINSYLSLRPELDMSLDDVMARDLSKRDRWMNLEWEREIVALELEDLIFDQMLEEVLCS